MSKHIDLTYQKFGKLTVLGKGDDYISPSGSHLLRWKCQCECGNIINATTSQLKRGQSSCGCIPKREDLTGRKFHKLTVIHSVEDYVSPKGLHIPKWHCICECGNEIDVLGISLKSGDTKSCGCYNKNRIRPTKDYTGRQFGELYVIQKIENSDPTKYLCKCSCGKTIEVLQRALSSGKKTHCGCRTVRKKPINPNYKQAHNFVGETFGELTVLCELEPHITPNGSKQRIVQCKCSCGNIFTIRLTNAKKSQKCKDCLDKDRRIDITGQRFGKLMVVSMAKDYTSPTGHRLSRCNCHCDCGNNVTVNMSALVTGFTKSCGCLNNTCGLLKDNPDLVEKYDFEKNEEAELDFNTLTARTSAKAWWKCNVCGNSWFATVASQNDKIKHGCPYCSGRLVVKGKTDLLSQNPLLAEEWDYEKNTSSPDEILSHSNQKVWWKCKEGHSWKAQVSNRANGAGCPRCNAENVNSFCEQSVYFYIKQAFPDAINSDNHIGMELDIFIPSKNIAIEYDGEAWHRSAKKTSIDVRKNDLCKSHNIELIRIREPKLEAIENCTVFIRKNSTANETLDDVISEVLIYLGISDFSVDTKRDTSMILEQFATKKYDNSLAFLFPEIAAEWHPTKNGNLTPDKVNKMARYKVWWLGKCGHEWQMPISSRSHQQQGCPYCNSKRILIGFNDLQSNFPKIAAEWHPTKNGNLKPTDIMPKSSQNVWWMCEKGHEWKATPNSRSSGSGCPICFKQRRSPAVVCVETGEVFENIKDAMDFCGLKGMSTIYKCCRGEQDTADGYHWKYYEENSRKGGEKMYPTEICWLTGNYTDDCICEFCEHKNECSGYEENDD